jgi:predicted DNA-binding transcriptional regulator YafY
MASVSRLQRLLRLVELLQSGRIYNSKDLAEICGVSRRTVFRDLRTLQDSDLPLQYDERKQGYSFSLPTYLPPTNFTLDETLFLLILCDELGHRSRGVPLSRSAQTAAFKLLSNLPRHLREKVGELAESISVRIDSHNPLFEAKPHYDLLLQAISERRQIRIRYNSLFKDERGEIGTLLSPYRLLFNRRSWYVIGRSSLHREIRTFNIGRILAAEMLTSRFTIPERFSLDRYLRNAWSLIRERGKTKDVVIRFQKKVAQNVAEVQWHKTQKLVWNADETLDYHVTVDGMLEISWWILGYGEEAEVLEPPELRELIFSKIQAMQQVYKKKN